MHKWPKMCIHLGICLSSNGTEVVGRCGMLAYFSISSSVICTHFNSPRMGERLSSCGGF